MKTEDVRIKLRDSISQYFDPSQLDQVANMAMTEFVNSIREEFDLMDLSLPDQHVLDELVKRIGVKESVNLTNEFISGMLEELSQDNS